MKSDLKNKLKRNLASESVNGLTVSLPSQVVVKDIPAYQIKTDKIKIIEMIDDSTKKTITAYTKQFGKVVLWEGAAYDSIGQWTDDEVKSKLISLYVK
jgi:hypothetical protein